MESAAPTPVLDIGPIKTEFQNTLKEIEDKRDPDLDDFRKQYSDLFQALLKSHSSYERLNTRIAELMKLIGASQEKISRAKKEEEDAHLYRKRLENEIASIWSQVEESHKREAENTAKVEELRGQTKVLKEQLSSGSGWTEDQKSIMTQKEKRRNDLSRQVEQGRAALDALKGDTTALHEEMLDAEKRKTSLEAEIDEMNHSVQEKKQQSEKEQRRKDRLDKELKQLKGQVEKAHTDLEDRRYRTTSGDESITAMEKLQAEAKNKLAGYLRDYDALFRKTHKLTEECDEQVRTNQLLTQENLQREQEITVKQGEAEGVKMDSKKMERLRDMTLKKIDACEKEKGALEQERDDLKGQINQKANIEMESLRKEGESFSKEIDNLLREREILNKKLVKGDDKTRKMDDLNKINLNTKKNLENEINGFRTHVKKQRDMIQQLVQDRERYEAEAEAANQKFFTALEEVKLQELQIGELQKRIVEGETRLKQQQNLYEAVRSDRNLYSKNLIESQEEIGEMKRKFKIMNHQIEQLKEEITAKDHSLVKEHFDHHKVDKEKEQLKNELTRIRKQIQQSEQIISNQESEIQKLSQIIQEADEERQRQQKEYDAVINERDILGSQLIRRSEELSTLYEKIKIQKSTLSKGEVQYQERVGEIELLKNRIKELQLERSASSAQVANIGDLRNEVYRLQRELLQERTKIKALTEELERHLNVHRWRTLQGSDPQRFEMIRKIHSLNKRLIAKTQEVVEKDLLIQEKEKLYVELKNILARQPGPEVAEQLAVYQQNLKDKLKQMKAMKAELEMYKAQVIMCRTCKREGGGGGQYGCGISVGNGG
jgi:chromosome segregation ATPase